MNEVAETRGQALLPDLLREGKVLEGPFWTERVRVVSVKKIGLNIEIQAVGLKTNTFCPTEQTTFLR